MLFEKQNIYIFVSRSCGGEKNLGVMKNFVHKAGAGRIQSWDGETYAETLVVHLKKLAKRVPDHQIIVYGILPVGPTSDEGKYLAGCIDRFLRQFQNFFLKRWVEHAQENILFFECATLPDVYSKPGFFGSDNRPNHEYMRLVNSSMAGVARAVSLGLHRSFCPNRGMLLE